MPPTVFITGATDGIGYALAKLYRERGARLILHGRRPLTSLTSSLFTSATYCQVDLVSRECAAQIQTWLDDRAINHIDVLIQNAGLGYAGTVASQSPASIQTLVDVNLRAPIALTHALLPRVRAAGDEGVIAFVSSVAASLPAPDYAVYAATKAALDGFAANLRTELQHRPRIVVVHPGATRTGMHAKAGLDADTSRYASPEHIAASIQRAIDTGTRQTTIGVLNQLLRSAGRNLPGVVDWLTRKASS